MTKLNSVVPCGLFVDRPFLGTRDGQIQGSRGVLESPFEGLNAREIEPGRPRAIANILLNFFSFPDYGFPLLVLLPSTLFIYFFFQHISMVCLFFSCILFFLIVSVFSYYHFPFRLLRFLFPLIPCFVFSNALSYFHCYLFFFSLLFYSLSLGN